MLRTKSCCMVDRLSKKPNGCVESVEQEWHDFIVYTSLSKTLDTMHA